MDQCRGHQRGRIIGMSVRLENERLSQVNYGTIPAQPIEIHMTHFFRVIIHQPDGGSAPPDGGLATVFVGDCECLLRAKPALVGGEKLEVALDVVQNCVLRVFDISSDVINIPLQAAVDVSAE